MHTISDNRAI